MRSYQNLVITGSINLLGALQATASSATTASFANSAMSASFATTASSVTTLSQPVLRVLNKIQQGTSPEPSGTGSVALGHNNRVSASYAVALGSNNLIPTQATSAFAVGQFSSASAPFQFVAGQFNSSSENQEDLFIIGNGDETGRKNLAVFNKSKVILSGSVNISGSLLLNGVPVGEAGATVTISGSIPSGSQKSGSLWWNNNDGNLYIQSVGPTGSTYVPAVNTVAGGNYGATFRENYSASIWSVNHGLGTLTPIIEVYSGSQVMIPASIVSTSPTLSTITFASIVSGSVVASTGIGGITSASYALSTFSSTSSSFASNANTAMSSSYSLSSSYSVSASFSTSASLITGTSGSGPWVWSMGNPTGSGWTLYGNAVYSASAVDGAVLTPATGVQNGSLYRSFSTSYFTTEEFILSANILSGGGTGGDGVALFVGNSGFGSGQYEGITVFVNEYNGGITTSDVIEIWKSGTLLTKVDPGAYLASGSALDNSKARKWELIVDGPQTSRFVTVTVNDVILYRVNVGSWTPSGAYCGAWGFTGGVSNKHAVPSICLKPAKIWKMSQGLL